jgi:hypothetical protein
VNQIPYSAYDYAEAGSEDGWGKNNLKKWTGGVTEEVEHLLCKYKALSSNPTPTKNPNNFKKPQTSHGHVCSVTSLSFSETTTQAGFPEGAPGPRRLELARYLLAWARLCDLSRCR